MRHTRREFVRRTCCTAAALGVASSFSRFGLVNALAQAPASYQALVCIFLFGGNDANNMLVPLDSVGYPNYLNIRKDAVSAGGLAIAEGSLLGIMSKTKQPVNSNNMFGMHPAMPELQNLFANGELAFLANVGSLIAPTTKAQYQAKTQLPSNLFSHADQQAQWQTSEPNEFATGGLTTSGWAGRVADKVKTFNGSSTFPPVTSVAGTAIFCTGQQTQPYAMIPGSTPGLIDTNASRLTALNNLLTFDTGISMIQSASSITSNALTDSKTLSAALASGGTINTPFPNPATGIGNQLLQVAKIMKVRSALGLGRQIFFCSLGGFDTHTDQINAQQKLYTQLSQAMNAFYNATVELNLQQNVTTFTMSDFSRTFQPASGVPIGSDHAWGSVQMMMGGAVVGGDIYGALPTFALGGLDDSGSNGRWIPTTSIDQYGATLATWFGVQASDLPAIFPNIGNFTKQNLGFLG